MTKTTLELKLEKIDNATTVEELKEFVKASYSLGFQTAMVLRHIATSAAELKKNHTR